MATRINYKIEIVDSPDNNEETTLVDENESENELHAMLNVGDSSKNIDKIIDVAFNYERFKEKLFSLYPDDKDNETIKALNDFIKKLHF